MLDLWFFCTDFQKLAYIYPYEKSGSHRNGSRYPLG